MANKFEEFDIEFKIVSNKNENVYVEGYVTINDEEGEDVDWYYYDAQGFATPQMFIEHNGVDGFKGATEEQKWEVEQFRADYGEDAFWIDTAILQSNEAENRTYVRENCTLIINEGAQFEVKIEDYNSSEWDAQYYMAFTPKFNEKVIELDDDIYFEEPFTYEDIEVSKMVHENGAYIIEVPKIIFEDPEETEAIADILKEYKEAFEYVYKKSLIRELGVYGIAYSFITEKLKEESSMKVFDKAFIQDWASSWEENFEDNESVIDLYFMTSDDVESIIKEEYEEEVQNEQDAQRDYEIEVKEREEELKREFGF